MLPAPRDPHAREAAPPDPPPAPPPAPPPDPPPLAPQLTGLLRSAGAQAVHAVDAGRGDVLVEVGLADGDDVPALVQLVRAAKALGRGRGEWLEDLVVTLGRTVHVLRECDGVVLHVRLDPARGDVGAVRRALASPGLLRAAEAAGRAAAESAAAERAAAQSAAAQSAAAQSAAAESAGAGGRGVRAGRPGPVRGGAVRSVPEPPAPQAPAPLPPAGQGRAAGPRPAAAGAPWPYSLPAPAAATPSPGRGAAHPVGPRPADQAGQQRVAAPDGPALTALPTAPAMRRVAPTPRQVPPRPVAGLPAPRPQPSPRPQSAPQSVPQPSPPPVPQPSPQPRPSPPPPPQRLLEPPPVPLPRTATGPGGPDGRDPALVRVDGGAPLASSGALAVLALPPVAALPRRRAAPTPPIQSPRGIVTPPVLRQPWASDVGTMRRLVVGLHRID